MAAAIFLTKEQFIGKAKAVHGDRYDCGCPRCGESVGEAAISRVLNEIGLPYKREAKFDTCKYKRRLPFDFLVKLAVGKGCLIEYHGEQHYRPIRWCKRIAEKQAQELFEKAQHRDRIKEDWASAKGIPFLIVPYWEFDTIEPRISAWIKGLQ